MVNFDQIIIGGTYARPDLAVLWGYKSFQAISRGVFTPRDQKIMVFFVTEEKQESLTQYKDHIDADILFWEGEKGHRSDQRILNGVDEIHVFFRKRHHSDFIYEGRAVLTRFRILSDRPSEFSFHLVDRTVTYTDIVSEIQNSYEIKETVKKTIISARIGQGKYRNESIKLWHSCAVTGFSNEKILIASHIKPWIVSDHSERINPYNSLLLVPTIDKLFDRGYIGFEPGGEIMISDKISSLDKQRISLSSDMKLRTVPYETSKFLEYHCQYVYDYEELR